MKIDRERAVAALLALIAMIWWAFGFIRLIQITNGWIVLVIVSIAVFAWIYSAMWE